MSMVQAAVFVGLFVLAFLCASCGDGPPDEEKDDCRKRRESMVAVVRRYGVSNQAILDAMNKVRRHVFIPKAYRVTGDPYGDHPCPIGYNQTISQPFIVAYMTDQMKLHAGEKVLEIGTGSGYQAAILAELGATVYTIEIVPELAEHARQVLAAEGYEQVKVRSGDGYKGWPEFAPFDAIIVTCAPADVPKALVAQLREGGRMIVPVGVHSQRLVILRKKNGKVAKEDDIGVRFVPMVHKETE